MPVKVDLVIPTCDRYRNVTRPVLFSLEKFYPERGQAIIVGYRTPDYQLPPNVAFVSVGEDKTPGKWTNGLKHFIASYQKDYLILHMDDHLLVEQVDSALIERLCTLMEEDRHIDKIMLHPFTASMFQPYLTPYKELVLFKCENGIGTTTLMNAIWRRDYLLELLNDDLGPHDFEKQSLHLKLDQKVVLATHNRIMMVTSLVNGGVRNADWTKCPRNEFEFTVTDEGFIAQVNALMGSAVPGFI